MVPRWLEQNHSLAEIEAILARGSLSAEAQKVLATYLRQRSVTEVRLELKRGALKFPKNHTAWDALELTHLTELALRQYRDVGAALAYVADVTGETPEAIREAVDRCGGLFAPLATDID